MTRSHPDVLVVDGDETDDLYVLRGKEAVYRWGEVYDLLGHEDRQSLQAAVWGIYVHEPNQRLAAAKARAVKEDASE